MYVWLTAFRLSVFIFFKSLRFWNIGQWLAYWLTFPKERVVLLCGEKMTLRTGTLHEKVVDLFMAEYCLCAGAYVNQPDFNIVAGSTVVDLGAHIGSFSVLALRRGARVISVEPDPNNFKMLRANTAQFGRRSVLVNKAVAGKTGELTFYKNRLNSAKNSATLKGSVYLTVPAITLEDLFREWNISRCDFLKFDAEGIEYEVIQNTSLATLLRIDRLVMELHEPSYFDIDESVYSKAALINKLKTAGFEIKIVPENKMHVLVFARRV